jgi:hypothetical protein
MLRLVYPKKLNHGNRNLAGYLNQYLEFVKIYRKIVSHPTATHNQTARSIDETDLVRCDLLCPPLETRLSIEHAPAFDETHELFYEA